MASQPVKDVNERSPGTPCLILFSSATDDDAHNVSKYSLGDKPDRGGQEDAKQQNAAALTSGEHGLFYELFNSHFTQYAQLIAILALPIGIFRLLVDNPRYSNFCRSRIKRATKFPTKYFKLFMVLLVVSGDVLADTRYANNQAAFYNMISNGGSQLMANNDVIVMPEGTFKCGICDNLSMYDFDKRHGTIRCKVDNLECVNDAEYTNRIFHVWNTARDALTMRSLKFFRGKTDYGGGGICVNNFAHVVLEMCSFESCDAGTGIGGGIYAYGDCKIDIYMTSFIKIVPLEGIGKDVFIRRGIVNIYETCPYGQEGEPAAGESSLWPYPLAPRRSS